MISAAQIFHREGDLKYQQFYGIIIIADAGSVGRQCTTSPTGVYSLAVEGVQPRRQDNCPFARARFGFTDL